MCNNLLSLSKQAIHDAHFNGLSNTDGLGHVSTTCVEADIDWITTQPNV